MKGFCIVLAFTLIAASPTSGTIQLCRQWSTRQKGLSAGLIGDPGGGGLRAGIPPSEVTAQQEDFREVRLGGSRIDGGEELRFIGGKALDRPARRR